MEPSLTANILVEHDFVPGTVTTLHVWSQSLHKEDYYCYCQCYYCYHCFADGETEAREATQLIISIAGI